jgi:hypothetical protein
VDKTLNYAALTHTHIHTHTHTHTHTQLLRALAEERELLHAQNEHYVSLVTRASRLLGRLPTLSSLSITIKPDSPLAALMAEEALRRSQAQQADIPSHSTENDAEDVYSNAITQDDDHAHAVNDAVDCGNRNQAHAQVNCDEVSPSRSKLPTRDWCSSLCADDEAVENVYGQPGLHHAEHSERMQPNTPPSSLQDGGVHRETHAADKNQQQEESPKQGRANKSKRQQTLSNPGTASSPHALHNGNQASTPNGVSHSPLQGDAGTHMPAHQDAEADAPAGRSFRHVYTQTNACFYVWLSRLVCVQGGDGMLIMHACLNVVCPCVDVYACAINTRSSSVMREVVP